MRDRKKIRIHIPGGHLPPASFRSILTLANSFGAESIEPGARQELLFDIPASGAARGEHIIKLNSLTFPFDDGEKQSTNLLSSHPVIDIYSRASWVSEGMFLDIFSDFKEIPKLKVNIIDLAQEMFPWWGGNLNFVSSERPGFWHLIWQDKDKVLKVYPELIYTNLIHSVATELSNSIIENRISPEIQDSILFNDFLETQNKEKWAPKKFPETEGFHRYGDRFWLGLYSRNHKFPISLLESLSQISTLTKSVKIGITPWKTFLFRDIKESDLPNWIDILEKYKWNTRHSGLELAWYVTDHEPDAWSLKKKVLKKLDSMDIFPSGFSIGIFSEGEIQLTHIRVQRKFRFPNWPFLGSKYSIYYSNTPWDKNSQVFPMSKVNTSSKVVDTISDLISGKAVLSAPEINKIKPLDLKEIIIDSHVRQCPHCWTVYDSKIGDLEQGIIPNTSWDEVPNTYKCSVCEAGKTEFTVKR